MKQYINAIVASGFSLDPGVLILNLILTVAIYSLPIIIYRYAIRKEPVSPKTGKTITIVYGIAAWLIAVAIISASGSGTTTGGAVFLWSYVNYAMLTKGWVQHRDTESAAQERETDLSAQELNGEDKLADSRSETREHKEAILPEQPEAEINYETIQPTTDDRKPSHDRRPKYCELCGNKLHSDDQFCDSCGARITDIPKE